MSEAHRQELWTHIAQAQEQQQGQTVEFEGTGKLVVNSSSSSSSRSSTGLTVAEAEVLDGLKKSLCIRAVFLGAPSETIRIAIAIQQILVLTRDLVLSILPLRPRLEAQEGSALIW